MNFLREISVLISTSFGLGYLTKFPGTLASILILAPFWHIKKNVEFNYIIFFLMIFILISFVIVNFALKSLKEKDPKCIILDEYIGQSIALMFCNETIKDYIIAFILFRIFDILKPFPIIFFDRIDNSFGVIMDDIVAGLIAGLIIFLVLT